MLEEIRTPGSEKTHGIYVHERELGVRGENTQGHICGIK
jgi:hypothetical protein